MIDRPEWWDDAKCKGMGTKIFFGPENLVKETVAKRRRRENEAKAVCRQCPTQIDCLAEALKFGDDGIRGGLTRYERQQNAPKILQPNTWEHIAYSTGLKATASLERRNGLTTESPDTYRVLKHGKLVMQTLDETEAWIALYHADL